MSWLCNFMTNTTFRRALSPHFRNTGLVHQSYCFISRMRVCALNSKQRSSVDKNLARFVVMSGFNGTGLVHQYCFVLEHDRRFAWRYAFIVQNRIELTCLIITMDPRSSPFRC